MSACSIGTVFACTRLFYYQPIQSLPSSPYTEDLHGSLTADERN